MPRPLLTHPLRTLIHLTLILLLPLQTIAQTPPSNFISQISDGQIQAPTALAPAPSPVSPSISAAAPSSASEAAPEASTPSSASEAAPQSAIASPAPVSLAPESASIASPEQMPVGGQNGTSPPAPHNLAAPAPIPPFPTSGNNTTPASISMGTSSVSTPPSTMASIKGSQTATATAAAMMPATNSAGKWRVETGLWALMGFGAGLGGLFLL